MINLTNFINVSCRYAIDNASTLHVRGPGFDCRRWILSFRFFFVLLFCFVLLFLRKKIFHFLIDLKYTGRLVAGSLSAFISNIQ